jgi:hypothetical protein
MSDRRNTTDRTSAPGGDPKHRVIDLVRDRPVVDDFGSRAARRSRMNGHARVPAVEPAPGFEVADVGPAVVVIERHGDRWLYRGLVRASSSA